MFYLSDLQYCHCPLQDISSLIVQHPQNCDADLAAFSHKTQIEFYEKKVLNLHHNFVDVIQSKRTNLADSNDNIADQTSKRSAVLPAQ